MGKAKKDINDVKNEAAGKNTEVDESNIKDDEQAENLQSKPACDEEEKTDAKSDEAKEYFSQMQRIQAEFDNYRKRVVKERSELIKSANENLLLEMLPLIDNFQRALMSLEEHVIPENKTFCEGVEMIYRQFVQLVEKNGVKPIETVGKPFDPNFHNAIQQVASSDVPENHIVEEVSKGYTLYEKLLRPSMVIVAKPEENETGDAAE